MEQKACQGAMPLPVGAYNLRGNNSAVFHFVYFKLAGMAKVLEYLAVFIGNCNLHNMFSFYRFQEMVQAALRAGAELVAAASNGEGEPFHQKTCQFSARLGVQRLDGGAPSAHLGCRFLLRKPLVIQ
jgi:hypothetical protein